MASRVLSIDPGGTGGIALFINGELSELHLIPKVKTKVDYNELSKLFKELVIEDTFIIMEEVHAIFGSSSKSTFSFGHINGYLLGMIVSSGAPYTMVQPKKWQKDIWISQDMVYKTAKVKKVVDTKSTSILAAKRLFPHTDFRPSSRAKKFHDGLVDAALIGKYFLHGFSRDMG